MNKFNTKTTIFLAAAAVLAFCACSVEPAAPELAPGVIRLSLGAEATATKVTFENDQTFKWSAGDKVGAYMYSTTLPNTGIGEGTYGPWIAPFDLISGAGTGNGEFAFEIKYPENGETVGHVAMYPYTTHEVDGPWEYQSSFSESNSTLVFNLPDKWKDLPNLEGVRIPMAANLDSGTKPVMFKHVGGAVKVTLKNVPANARYFKLAADKNLSGEFVIRQDEIGTGTLRGDGSYNYVELQLAEGAGKALSSVDVYFPVPAGTFTFSLGVYGDGIVILEKTGTTANTIGRGQILRLPEVDLSGSTPGPGPNPGGQTGIGEYDPNLDPANKLSGLTYQMNVYTFADSNGDGVGDFQGIIDHLDYLDALGVTAIWLSPLHPAESYHGYDPRDYSAINPKFGDEDKFRELCRECHKKNIRIYMDYVINHTGNGHTWFKDAIANGPGSTYWDYYCITKTPEEDVNAGLIPQLPKGWIGWNSEKNRYDNWFKVTVTADGGNYWYYSGFDTGFFADLNYWHGDNCEQSPAFNAVVNNISEWLGRGVDGLRLDAVKHIYADETGPENIQFWQKFYDQVNSMYNPEDRAHRNLTGKADPNIFMVGEVLSGDGVCSPFFAGLPAIFDFQYWWDLRDALNWESGAGIAGGIIGRYNYHNQVRQGAGKGDAIYTPKLSNHDENRTAEELGNYGPKIRLAATILLTSPGRPFIYQGEELGYWGAKGSDDRYVRTPILWTTDLSSAAFKAIDNVVCDGMLTPSISVETQAASESSLLTLYRRFAYARNINPAMADGYPDGDEKNSASVISWYMKANDGSGKVCLVMHNITGSSQTVERWDGENLSNVLVASESMTVNGKYVTMPPYSSVVFALN